MSNDSSCNDLNGLLSLDWALCFWQVLVWDIGKLNPQKLPNLRGTLTTQAGAPKPEDNPSLNIAFKIQQLAISGTSCYMTSLGPLFLLRISN